MYFENMAYRMQNRQNQKFWTVLAENSNHTSVRHPSPQSAINEAARLSRHNPGTKFFVLEAVGYQQTVSTSWTPLK